MRRLRKPRESQPQQAPPRRWAANGATRITYLTLVLSIVDGPFQVRGNVASHSTTGRRRAANTFRPARNQSASRRFDDDPNGSKSGPRPGTLWSKFLAL